MAEEKKGFILYADLIHTVIKLPDDKAGLLLKHILSYVNDENPETDDIIIEIAFEPIKQQLKRDLKHWEHVKEVRSENGKLGGRPKKLKEAKKPNALLEKQTKAKKPVIDNVIVNVNDTVTDIKKIPSLEDFKSFAVENCKDINIESVELKYKAWVENDWKDGKDKKIKNWKTKLLNTLTYLPKNGTNKRDQDGPVREPSKNINTKW